jgi:hypothetical protein
MSFHIPTIAEVIAICQAISRGFDTTCCDSNTLLTQHIDAKGGGNFIYSFCRSKNRQKLLIFLMETISLGYLI